jgi:hypothetical protein
MKVKALLGLLLALQATFFIFVLFTAPNPAGHLKVALQDLNSGNVSNVAGRISSAINGYEFQTTIALLVALGTLVISALLIFFVRRAEKSRPVSRTSGE